MVDKTCLVGTEKTNILELGEFGDLKHIILHLSFGGDGLNALKSLKVYFCKSLKVYSFAIQFAPIPIKFIPQLYNTQKAVVLYCKVSSMSYSCTNFNNLEQRFFRVSVLSLFD